MKTALIVTCFNRPEYLRQCFFSLDSADIPKDCTIIIVDDFSTDPDTIRELARFTLDTRVFKVSSNRNEGIRSSLKKGYELAWGLGAKYVINLDSDAIVKKGFVQKIIEYKERFPLYIISGFNSKNTNKDGSLRNPVVEEKPDHLLKKYANGINMCVTREEYDQYVLPALNKTTGNWDFLTSSAHPNGTIVIKPSVVQHIGLQSSMGHNHEDPDVACDFKDLFLPQVTLFGIDAHDPEGLIRAATICTDKVEFGEVKIITERLFSGREAYSKFCIKDMASYVHTSHVLIIHPDGYVINPGAWKDDWLEWDYIGAPWEWYEDEFKNGNGGFSLRSKKLLNILANEDLFHEYHPEDHHICRTYRKVLEKQYGIKFAPLEVCRQFSIEAYAVKPPGNRWDGQFGFHGYHADLSAVPENLRPLSRVPTPVPQKQQQRFQPTTKIKPKQKFSR